MKIEQVNENQIRCILTQEDLEERKIKFSELTYGSEKANRLFKDVMQQANEDYGFSVDEHPLMIEAVPMQSGMIVFVITKVTAPDEFDSRLNQLVSALHGDADENADDDASLSLNEEGDGFSASIRISSSDDNRNGRGALSLRDLFHEMFSRGAEISKKQNPAPAPVVRQENRVFTFGSIGAAIDAARSMQNLELGESTLYKDPADGRYYLLLYADYLTPGGYQQLTVSMADFSEGENLSPSMEAYMEEHYTIVIPEHALQLLSGIK